MTAKSILVIDDDRDFAEGLADLLELNGHRTTLGYSGEEAVASAADQHFDAVLMDMMLPGMSGLDALAAIHENEPGTKIVLMSGRDVRHFSEQPKAESAHGALQKPFDPEQLMAAIDCGCCDSAPAG